MPEDLRMTLQTQRLLFEMLKEPRGQHYGLEIARAARLSTGSIYPILARLEKAGWVVSAWEDIDEREEGRRRRRYYRLTALGERRAFEELERMRSEIALTVIPEPA